MKTFSRFLLSFIFVLSLSLHAQNTKNIKAQTQSPLPSTPLLQPEANDVKGKFIAEQDYLFSASSFKDYNRFYGDSLDGFDEAGIKASLVGHNVYGKEYLGYIGRLKRDYINKKYSTGGFNAQNNQPSSSPISYGRPIGGGNVVINNAPCVNEDFESTLPGAYNTGNAVTGWVISSRSRTACNFTGAFTAGSPEFSIVATPVLNILPSGNVLNVTPLNASPLGGTNVALLNDQTANLNEIETKISQTFPVTSANTLFQFSFAGAWQDGGHACCEQPALQVNMYSCTGAPLACSSLSLNAYGLSCLTGATGYSTTNNGWSWTNWQTRFIDLTPYLGTCVTIEFSNSDCIFGGHAGSVYIDTRCGGSAYTGGNPLPGAPGGPIPGPVSFCAGANQALVNAPLGYSTYQWYGPGSPPVVMSPTVGGNTAGLTINNPVAGAVYTVQLVTASGCTFTALDTLKFSTVSIAGIGSSSTCPGGANGSATVAGNGSGAGYNYNWYALNSNVTIGTSSVVTGLAAGIYSVNISGLGSAGCGSAAATVTVGVGPPNVYTIIKPFCGNEAYLGSSGTNFQWYSGLTAITGTAGTASNFTATSPYNGQFYWLTYTTLQGCRDSVQFVLSQSPPGNMYVTGISYACPGVANATANIVMNPASGAPPGINSYSVFSISSSPSPAYSASLFPSSLNNYTAMNMPAGTYSVIGFDGSCKYGATFIVNDYVYSYVLSPTTSTLCPGNTLLAGASFNTPITLGQYNFQWSPATYIVGGPVNTTNISIQIAPVIPSGSIVTTIYSLTVVPTIVNCPITQTISVTAVNLQTPTFTIPAEFCNNASQKTITVSPNPVAGVFSTSMGTWLGAGSGVITPGLTSIGTNTFMYTVSVSTCAVSNTGSFIVSKFNTAALTGTILNQCVTNPCINLMSLVQSTVSGYWEGLGVNANTFCPSSFTTFTSPSVASTSTLTYKTSSSPNPTLCPDTRTLVVSISHTVAPIISALPPFCTNVPSFGMAVSPSGGNWSSSTALLITPAGIVNPANASIGNTQLTYVVTTGACQNLATTTISAVQFHSAALTGSVSNLCTNSAPVNLMGIVASPVNGVWSIDNGVSPTGVPIFYNQYLSTNIFSPSPANVPPLPTGTYTLHYSTTSAPTNVCPDTRSLTVFVLNPPTPTITAVVPHCNADGAFQVLVTPTTGSFVPTAYLTAGGLFTPSLAMVGNNTVQYVIGTNTCNVNDSKVVSIEGFVAPTITGTVPDQCSTNVPVDLSNITLNSTGGWLGSGILGSSFYPTSSGSGIIVLTYTTASLPSGLCPAQATLAVNVFSLATPVIDDEGPYCNSKAPIQLKVTPLGGVFSGQNNTAVNALGRFNPSSAMIGDNIINYSVTAGPCVAYGQTTISIEKFISADFLKYAGPFCKNDVPFDINGIVQNPGGDFTGPGMSGSLFTPAHANIGNNNLIIYLTHSMPTASLCPDTSAVRIQVNDVPDVSAVAGPQKGCSPVEVTFNSPNGGAGKGEWTLGDGSDPMPGLTVIHTYTAAGTYSAVFNYWDEIGCTVQKLVDPIVVYPSPKADFTYGPYDELTISDPEVQFTNLSTVLGKNTYEWQIGDLYNLTDVSPQVIFPKIGKYEITLTATTINNCKDKISRVIEIRNDFGVYIPNSFTPNDDGLNDVFAPVFSPYGLDAKTFDMEIFDRWGTSLYHTRDVTKGWDGTVQNKGGDRLKQDVYVYKIKYKDMDGLIYNKLGHVTLLR